MRSLTDISNKLPLKNFFAPYFAGKEKYFFRVRSTWYSLVRKTQVTEVWNTSASQRKQTKLTRHVI